MRSNGVLRTRSYRDGRLRRAIAHQRIGINRRRGPAQSRHFIREALHHLHRTCHEGWPIPLLRWLRWRGELSLRAELAWRVAHGRSLDVLRSQ